MGRKPELPALTGFIFAGDSQTIDLNHEWEKWQGWLQRNESFRYVPDSPHPGFTLRSEKDSKGHQHYWYAYRKESGKLRRCYVGKNSDLHPKKLEAVAKKLSSPTKGKQHKIVTEKQSVTNDELKQQAEINARLEEKVSSYREVTEKQSVTIEQQKTRNSVLSKELLELREVTESQSVTIRELEKKLAVAVKK